MAEECTGTCAASRAVWPLGAIDHDAGRGFMTSASVHHGDVRTEYPRTIRREVRAGPRRRFWRQFGMRRTPKSEIARGA
jgi:hypothetical protein